jgi:hypothetical protein
VIVLTEACEECNELAGWLDGMASAVPTGLAVAYQLPGTYVPGYPNFALSGAAVF